MKFFSRSYKRFGGGRVTITRPYRRAGSSSGYRAKSKLHTIFARIFGFRLKKRGR